MIVHPATAERWPDIETLFGPRGATGGCWCMWWRKARSAFDRDKGDVNRAEFADLVTEGPPPGLIGYRGGEPVAWVALAPRSAYPVAARSRIARVPSPDATMWLISCLFVHRDHRRQGLSTEMVRQAVAFAAANGARIVDAVPVENSAAQPDVFVFTGLPSTFLAAGFVEIARPGPHRPLMRYEC